MGWFCIVSGVVSYCQWGGFVIQGRDACKSGIIITCNLTFKRVGADSRSSQMKISVLKLFLFSC
jgi:hypothetical protein